MNRRYCVITPCRDEAKYARRTLDSVCGQTIPPALWVIVDDGSTDQTPTILAEYAARHRFIEVITRTDRGARKVGPGVIDAFYAGLEHVEKKPGGLAGFDHLCKLDLDLDMPRGYFEELMRRMEAEPRLGCASGKAWYPGPSNSDESFDGELISEGISDEMSVGAAKFYRTACFQQIGGFVREVMWDGIDCHRCRMLGWIARSWDDQSLRFLHLRPMGSSDKGILKGRMRHGYGQYFMGTGLVYMTASALFRLAHPPRIIGGAAMWWGYVRSALRRADRYPDPAFRAFLRRYQWACLLRGKQRATEALNQRQAAVWSPPAESDAPARPAAATGVGA